ncbi:putative membrane-bound dehydrogenase domain-containing protein [Fodinibius sediminis]|uniref:Putative membrane-bound dehydrogenase domain-containing protein n=2 Tax=Fodinibius sediminis TaxID=1214077 RepID=A0A521CT76_9BACT|nr:putative membrane-bound dehydrogenase domain-containing protein [Fodinibius sediminis]
MAVVMALTFISCGEKKYPEPMNVEEALDSFRVDDRFEVQVYASEPHVMDPTSMVFDEKGNVYVVEMPDYPFKPEEGPGRGKIKKLMDRDGDGRIDDSVVFADSITDATSILPWKEGLLVTAAPNIWYFRDTDGDDRADDKEKVFSGFFENNQEAQITNLRFNVDNWIYASNHGQAGEVHFNRDPDAEPLSMAGADFRFRLDRGEFEPETAPGQFGQTFDKWGNRFVTQNTRHIQQMVIPYRYLHRHSYLPTTNGMANINDHGLPMYQLTEAPYWRAERTKRRNKRYQEQDLDRVEYADDHFTGASGGTYYGADLFPKEYRDNIFTGEVAGNLVHRDQLVSSPDQVEYTAQRPENEQDREFLASVDPWFRPTNFTVGPDGALYLLDYYRQHIETPLSIPEDLKEDMDFLRGDDMGRIYRIVPKDQAPTLPLGELNNTTASNQYVEWLSHPNRWFRLNAQRMLLQKQDKSVLPAVEELFMENENAVTRLHALYVMEGMDALTLNIIREALNDASPGVREHALILSERFPEVLPEAITLSSDPSHKVVLQAALSLGEFESEAVTEPLADILQEHYRDHWIRLGVLSSDAGSSMALFETLQDETGFFGSWDEEKEQFLHDFSYVTAARNNGEDMAQLLEAVSGLPVDSRKMVAEGFSGGLAKSEADLPSDVEEQLQALAGDGDEELKNIISNIIES